MIDNYTPNEGNNIHTVRVTLKSGDYTGHIAYKMGGNCQGFSVMGNSFEYDCQEDINKYVENDCRMRYDESVDIYLCSLTDDEGDTCDFEFNGSEMSDLIVAIEIIACEPEGEHEDEEE